MSMSLASAAVDDLARSTIQGLAESTIESSQSEEPQVQDPVWERLVMWNTIRTYQDLMGGCN